MNHLYFRCGELIYSDHAINQMFSRDISTKDVEETIKFGEIIHNYPNDKPFPSCLILGQVLSRPLHLVLAINKAANHCIVVTAYEPDPTIWNLTFKSKR